MREINLGSLLCSASDSLQRNGLSLQSLACVSGASTRVAEVGRVRSKDLPTYRPNSKGYTGVMQSSWEDWRESLERD